MHVMYARKVLYDIMWLLCTATGGTEQIRACVSRYDQSSWTANSM